MALQLPNEPSSGQPVRAIHIAQIIRYLKYLLNRINTLELGGGRGKKSASAPISPFTPSGSIEGGAAYVSFSPGLINNAIPTIEGTHLNMLVGEPPAAPKIAVSGAAGQVWVRCELDGEGRITDCIVQTGATIPVDDDDYAYRLLCTFTSASGQFTSLWQAITHNQSHKRCGGESTWGIA